MLFGVLCTLFFQSEPIWDDWKIVGPWPTPSVAEGLATKLPPEDMLARIQRGGDPNPRGTYLRDNGGRITWQDGVGGYPVNLSRLTGTRETSVGYLYRSVEVRQPGNLPVEIVADGAYRVWLNGAVITETPDEIAEAGSTVEIELPVQMGKNHILVKLIGPPNRFAFGMRTSFRWQSDLAELQGPIDSAIDRGVNYLLDRQMIDGGWGEHSNYPGGITPVVLYALLKCGLTPGHPVIERGINSMRHRNLNKTYTAGFTLLALAAADRDEYKGFAEEVMAWLISVLPNGSVYGYPGADDLSNHVVACLGIDAAARAYGINVDIEFWEAALKGALDLQTAEERVELEDGTTEYERGFTYRKGGKDASGSMTSAGMTVAILALKNGGSKIPTRLRKESERAIEQGALWLGNHWAVHHNPPNRSWHYFHLYGLERVGALMEREAYGGHPWYLEGARFLVDGQKDDDSWANTERDTAMSLLFLKRATSLAVTEAGTRTSPALATAEDADVVLRAIGDTPMTIWVADSRVAGTKSEFFASRVGEQLELNLGRGEQLNGRWTLRTQFPRPGRWEIWCRLDTPGGLLTSPKLQVAVRLVASQELMAASTAPLRNLLIGAEGLSWRSSSIRDNNRKPEKLVDGTYAGGWSSAKDDADPWVMLELRKAVRARYVRFTPETTRQTQAGDQRPTKLRVIINKREVFEIDVPSDPWEKAVLDLGKKVRIKQLEVHIAALHGGEIGQAHVGLSELELEE
ncbi:MAG: hypothetical protein MK209_00375 [Planctomycetes bacterium]|nr:hypothetical protein [Planctomycetota bacterium]